MSIPYSKAEIVAGASLRKTYLVLAVGFLPAAPFVLAYKKILLE